MLSIRSTNIQISLRISRIARVELLSAIRSRGLEISGFTLVRFIISFMSVGDLDLSGFGWRRKTLRSDWALTERK